MRTLIATFGVAATLVIGCSGATDQQLRARAAYDLKCNEGHLQVTEIDARTRGVRGCNQQVTYVESCTGGYGNNPGMQMATNECTWVLNGDSRRVQ